MAKLKKTPTEIKYEALVRKLHKSKRVNKSKVKPNYPTTAELKALPYKEFLKTKYWHIVRTKILKRDGHKCIICKNKTSLQVHHDSYKNHGNELKHLDELMTLCDKCHKEHHYSGV